MQTPAIRLLCNRIWGRWGPTAASNASRCAGLSSAANVPDTKELGARKLGPHDAIIASGALNTKRRPTYALPYYGAAEKDIESVSDAAVARILRIYGGLHRKNDTAADLRERLLRATRADYRAKQLCIEGVVVSNRMDKSVVVAARRRAYAPKLRLQYWRTRRFMAHDELNLCREGDRVVIRSCRPLSKRKAYVVVENFGDPTRLGVDERAKVLARVEAGDDDDDDDVATENDDATQSEVATHVSDKSETKIGKEDADKLME